MATDLLQSLVNMGGIVPPTPGQPLLVGENPLTTPGAQIPDVLPAATAAPQLNANITQQATSLEDLLFGGGLSG